MALTPEQRAAINRENSRKSTGPKTKEGKERSRLNATTHGLTATLPMPNEDPAMVKARSTSWNDYYKPTSPGAQHLLNVCVQSTLLSDRLARFHDDTIADQVRKAEASWTNLREAEVEDFKEMIDVDPGSAVRLLGQTAMGTAYLADRWKALIVLLQDRGFWTGKECAEVVQLCGIQPALSMMKANPLAFQISYFNALCLCQDPFEVARGYCDNSDIFPDTFWNTFRADNPPEPKSCHDWLYKLAATKFQTLIMNKKRLEETIDGPDKAGAANRALILQDEKTARLFLRYSSESRNAFHKAYGSLLKTLEMDKAREEEESRNEATTTCNPLPENEIESPEEGDSDDAEGFDEEPDREEIAVALASGVKREEIPLYCG